MKTGKLPKIFALGLIFVLLLLVLKERVKERADPGTGVDQQPRSGQTQGLSITQIVVDPQNPQVLYLSTMNGGIFKSQDRGKHWISINEGLKTLMIQNLVINPRHPQHLVAGTFGAGIYRSDNGGSFWIESNEGLTNTNIFQLVFHPSDFNSVYAMSFGGGIYKSTDLGQTWISWSEGINLLELRNNFVLLPVPVDPAIFYLGTSDGILKRVEGGPRWESASVGLSQGPKGRQVTSLAYDPRTKTLFAAVAFQGLFSSKDMGKSWSPLGDRLEEGALYSLTFDSSDPKVLFAVSTTKGVLKSRDGGISWIEMNKGLEGGSKALIQDPRDPSTFFTVAFTGSGLFVSTDDGTKWTHLESGFPSIETVTKAFSARMEKEVAPVKASPSPPQAFKKCNLCHGWTEPLLNLTPGPWKVAPSDRDWDITVKRMKKMIPDLSSSEEAEIIGFLNRHYGDSKALQKSKTGDRP